MATAMGTGAVVTGPVQEYVMMLRSWMKNNQMETVTALFVIGQFLESQRHSALVEAQTKAAHAAAASSADNKKQS